MYKMARMKYSNKTESKRLEKAKSPGTGVYLMQFIHSSNIFWELLCASAVLASETEPWTRQDTLRKPTF